MPEPDQTSKISPERRIALRVPVRRAVRAAIGLRSFEALLVDLSVTGCRLRCPEPVTAHGSLWIVLPAGFGGLFPLPVRGEVARAESVRGEPTGVCDVALRFRGLSPRACERLAAAVGQVLSPKRENPNGERRRAQRRWFGSRVVAGGPGHPRVLLARDLSVGGMQVENAAGLAAGEELQLALYSQAGDVPLVLRGRVVRCSAQGEAAFTFVAPSEAQLGYLEKLLASLPAVDAPVVAEILEPVA
jgi:PilZ domain